MLIDGFTLFGSWPGLPFDHPVEHLIHGLAKYRLDRACVLSTTGIFLDAAAGNAATAAAAQQDARLIPIGVADPRLNGREQVDYCKAQGFNIMALFPHSQGWALRNLPALGVLERLHEQKLPVMIEAGRDGDASEIYRTLDGMTMPVILLDVSLPTLTEAIWLLRARPNTYLATRWLCGGDTIELLAKEVGAERLIFTSGFPISCFSSAFLTAKFAVISDTQRAQVMGDTIAGLLGVPVA
jgi:predicted TIM-barrel fold metal-dependent hydrolase